MAPLSQGRTAAARCGLFTHKLVPVTFVPPCILIVLFYLFVEIVVTQTRLNVSVIRTLSVLFSCCSSMLLVVTGWRNRI